MTKYRIAIMRKQIDEKVKSEVGQRGYVCTSCSKTYDPLDLSHLFNPSTNTFTCENCGVGELVEFDPATRQDSNINGNGEKQDKMQKFNIATAPIRDALKQIEGITVPSVNILAWIALNVKSLPVPGEEAGKLDPTDKRFQVVIGEDGDEKERLEKARLVEAQRCVTTDPTPVLYIRLTLMRVCRTQNALPVWYTHSTVTGSATTLGLKNAAGPSSSTSAPVDPAQAAKDNEAALAEHYAMMMEHEEDSVKQEKDRSNGEALSTPIAVPEAAVPEVKREIVEDDDEDEMEGIVETSTPMVSVTGTSTPAIGLEMHKTSDVDKGPMLSGRCWSKELVPNACADSLRTSVGGIMKPLAEITDEDHEVMTSEEYQVSSARTSFGIHTDLLIP